MPQRFGSVSGWVLAGGESRRMGRPKDQLVVAGETMLARQIRLLRGVARSVAVLGPTERLDRLEVEVIPDEQPGLGPLGGIVTALGRTRTEYNLFLGCDLPFMEIRFLRFLSRQALACRADVTVPETPGCRLHPACAVYRRRALGAIRASLSRGDYRVRSFFPRVECRLLRWHEIGRQGFRSRIFDNMNTPEDYEFAQRMMEAGLSMKCEG